MDLLNANALTQSAGRHVATLGHINVLDATLCDNVCQLLATGRWFSTATLVFSTNKTHRHDKAEILLKVVLNTITVTIIRVHYQSLLLLLNAANTNLFVSSLWFYLGSSE